MSFFESLIALLLLAILLLQVSRRTAIPYPTLLAATGAAVALIPGTPEIELDGHTALALFIAPVLLDAAFDFPLAAIRTLWRPLIALAVFAVLATTAVVAWIGWAFAGLPIAAAVTLGAIVAPPDAAAATTVLQSARLPRRTVQLLTGESLLNDATALLLFGAAVAIQNNGGIDGGVGVKLALAAPGGIALGIACGWLMHRLLRHTRGSLGGNLLEFVNTYLAWIVAERLGLSAVLCVVATGMFVANSGAAADPRNRVQSFAVWSVAVFLLNVLAFMLMGMQARQILADMPPDRIGDALGFAGMVVAGVIGTRLVCVLLYNRLAAHFVAMRGGYPAPSIAQGVAVGWCGMRGLVTLATAFALPENFPQRELIVLSAFAVVLATLVLQGLTLAPLIRLLGLRDDADPEEGDQAARVALADAGLAALAGAGGHLAADIRRQFEIDRAALDGGEGCADQTERERLKLGAIAAQRDRLRDLRDTGAIADHEYLRLQEELDWRELAIGPGGRKSIEEN